MMERDQQIADNLGLVHACCQRFRGRGVEYDDLFQAGCVGLVRAIDRFEPDRGFAFSTYAVPVVLGEIRRLFREGGSVKVSRSLRDLGMKAMRRQEERAKEGCTLTLSELAEDLSVSVEDLAQALEATRPTLSLTVQADGDEEGQWDLSTGDEQETLCERMALQQAIRQLSSRDQTLLRLRFREEKTQTQTAQVLGMTQVQVSRREKAILGQIRAWMSAG